MSRLPTALTAGSIGIAVAAAYVGIYALHLPYGDLLLLALTLALAAVACRPDRAPEPDRHVADRAA